MYAASMTAAAINTNLGASRVLNKTSLILTLQQNTEFSSLRFFCQMKFRIVIEFYFGDRLIPARFVNYVHQVLSFDISAEVFAEIRCG